MNNPLRNLLRRFRDQRAAIDTAATYFEKTKMLTAHRITTKVVAEDDGGYVVRICYGHTKPLLQAWIIVNILKSTIKELSFHSVRQYGERQKR